MDNQSTLESGSSPTLEDVIVALNHVKSKTAIPVLQDACTTASDLVDKLKPQIGSAAFILKEVIQLSSTATIALCTNRHNVFRNMKATRSHYSQSVNSSELLAASGWPTAGLEALHHNLEDQLFEYKASNWMFFDQAIHLWNAGDSGQLQKVISKQMNSPVCPPQQAAPAAGPPGLAQASAHLHPTGSFIQSNSNNNNSNNNNTYTSTNGKSSNSNGSGNGGDTLNVRCGPLNGVTNGNQSNNHNRFPSNLSGFPPFVAGLPDAQVPGPPNANRTAFNPFPAMIPGHPFTTSPFAHVSPITIPSPFMWMRSPSTWSVQTE